MALPVILIDSGSGSDTAASGAGPATALTGSAASFAAAVVTLDGSPDLSGVATDGSHVLYLVTSSTNVKFFKITAKDDGADTVTVTPSPAGTATGLAWAIGGKRASIGSTESQYLVNRASSSGDSFPGWALEFQSGHAETIAAALACRRNGDATSGPIMMRGASGAATKPIITFSNNGIGINIFSNSWHIRDFVLKNSHATKTASVAIQSEDFLQDVQIRGMNIATSASKFWKGILLGRGSGFAVEYNTIQNCANNGIQINRTDGFTSLVRFNLVTDNGAAGCDIGAFAASNAIIYGNIFARNTTDGLLLNANFTTIVAHNTFDANGSDGMQASFPGLTYCFAVFNNIFSNNTGYGWNQTSGTDPTQLASNSPIPSHNCFYNNTAGTVPATRVYGENNITTNPTYTDSANNDFSVGANMKGFGAPTVAIGAA